MDHASNDLSSSFDRNEVPASSSKIVLGIPPPTALATIPE
jgi:hypothetical protein